MQTIEEQLEAARQSLLDLTMRNRLLNYRPTKLKTIRVVDEIPREVYDILVLQEGVMKFRPNSEESLENSISSPSEIDEEGPTKAEWSGLWNLPSPEEPLEDRYTDHFLQTRLDGEGLQRRLFHISQQSRMVLEEQGYTILFLAIGYLEWFESQAAQHSRRAPLILVPVELERTRVRTAFKLRWTGEDVQSNISLQAKLLEQGIDLPEFETPEKKKDVDQYFQVIAEAISDRSQWQIHNDIYLDFFSFAKFVMYKDLDPTAWPIGKSPAEHHLIQAILSPSSQESFPQGFSEDEVDQKLTARDVHHVMDADSSQIAVIEDVKAGRNLVVEGPPGTGKSQTITNIIAELLTMGKSVLFVSAKMAALEVVKGRLDQTGLGDFCLELHSRKTKKREVLKELERTLFHPPTPPGLLDEQYDQIEVLKADLNGYARALREPLGELQHSPFALFCLKEKAQRHFQKVGRSMPRIKLPNPESCTPKAWVAALSKLTQLADMVSLLRPLENHPWRGCKPSRTVLPTDVEEIGALLKECKKQKENLENALSRLHQQFGIQPVEILAGVNQALEAANVMTDAVPVERHVLMNEAWDQTNRNAEALIQKARDYQVQRSSMLSKFREEICNTDLASLLREYKSLSTSPFRIFNRRYRGLKREIHALYRETPERRRKEIVLDLAQANQCVRIEGELREAEPDGHSWFGRLWEGGRSDSQRLHTFSKWVVSFREALSNGILTDKAVQVITQGFSKGVLQEVIADLTTAGKTFLKRWNELRERLCFEDETILGSPIEQTSFSDMAMYIDRWLDNLARITRWSQFCSARASCLQSVAEPMVSIISEGKLEPDDVIPCFEASLADSLLQIAFESRPELLNFIGEIHEHKIERFRELDRQSLEWNRHRVAFQLYQDCPRIPNGASPGSEAGIILGEINKKRRHMPIRKLLSLAGGLIQRIKPCFMMSPLSIAQFLDPKTAQFDVIIFDEASQVRPEDALGALLRGRQVVVMGDTKQLPPTSFFDHLIEDTEDEETTTSISDVESILHQCRRCFPTKMLRWHYRSRHESLIAVSNQEFYDNNLLIYPSVTDHATYLGLRFVHLPHAVYDRGRSSVNRKEARAVAEAAVEHYKLFPDKSPGQRIKKAIEGGVAVAEAGGKIERRNAFLWPTGNSTPPVRRHIGDLSPKIEMICPEEIEEAIALVLRHQFDTRSEDLVVQVSRLFGFKATRDTTAKVIFHIVDQMIEKGRLDRLPNRMIHLIDSWRLRN